MYNELLLYKIALTLIPQIGPVHAKLLLQHFNVREIFTTKRSTLEKIEGLGEVRARSIRSFAGFREAETEIAFIEKYKIRPLFISDPEYPQRLLNCYDAPILLYYKGNADLNCSKVVALVGSRSHTEYGKLVTEELLRELASHHILIISGLAYGIDAISHKNSVKNNLPTVGVLAHGLDQIYPPVHSNLARDMLRNGGLLTEFRSTSKPDKHNFPVRNRIVAGLSDATIVVETGTRGGSMITAELANGYNRDVFAYPGRITDLKSAGCNQLIRSNKAVLLSSGQELLEQMGWEQSAKPTRQLQRNLFPELTDHEKIIVAILEKKDQVHIDELNLQSGLSSSSVAAALLNLEIQGMIQSLPGKLYGLI